MRVKKLTKYHKNGVSDVRLWRAVGHVTHVWRDRSVLPAHGRPTENDPSNNNSNYNNKNNTVQMRRVILIL